MAYISFSVLYFTSSKFFSRAVSGFASALRWKLQYGEYSPKLQQITAAFLSFGEKNQASSAFLGSKYTRKIYKEKFS